MPSPIWFEDDGNGWPSYWDRLYAVFCRDLISSTPTLFGLPVRISRTITDDGKHERFHHIASGHPNYDPRFDREIKLGRCAAVPWVRPMIDAGGGGRALRVWREWYNREREFRWHLALDEFCHLVVLAERPDQLFVITAFPIEYDREREKYRRRFERATQPPRKS